MLRLYALAIVPPACRVPLRQGLYRLGRCHGNPHRSKSSCHLNPTGVKCRFQAAETGAGLKPAIITEPLVSKKPLILTPFLYSVAIRLLHYFPQRLGDHNPRVNISIKYVNLSLLILFVYFCNPQFF